MKQAKVNSVLSLLLTTLVITLLIFLGPANAVNVSVSAPTTAQNANELVTFNAQVDIETSERLPGTNVSVYIREGNSVVDSCTFLINGSKLDCGADFESITLVTNNATFQNGSLQGTGFGSNESLTQDDTRFTFFGYGYGYGYGAGVNSELEYEISWRTPNLLNGEKTYGVEVVLNTQANSIGYNYKDQSNTTVTVQGKQNIENELQLDVEETIENGVLSFEIDSTLNTGERRSVKVRPVIECLDIEFELVDTYLNEELTIDDPKTFQLEVPISEFDLQFPYSTNCEFKVFLEETQFGTEFVLSEQATFEDEVSLALKTIGQSTGGSSQGSTEIEGELNNGNDIVGYIYSLLNLDLNSGYNAISFSFRNNGDQDIDIEMRITIADLFVDQFQQFDVESNFNSRVTFPIYVDEGTKPGMYPVRISYRINDGELKTKYGYIEITEE